jgi:hypothetical protein
MNNLFFLMKSIVKRIKADKKRGWFKGPASVLIVD